jgi:DNA-binding protein YbaB
VVDADDPQDTADTIADLVIAAVRDAVRAAADLQQEKLGPLAQGLGGGGLGQLPGF